MKEKTYYAEAMRYIDNAREILKKSPKEGGLYTDEKYVQRAAGTAYAGVNKAAKWFIQLNKMNIDTSHLSETQKGLAKINYKALGYFNNAYGILHIAAYYRDITGVKAIEDGLNYAVAFIKYLKLYKDTGVEKNGYNGRKKRPSGESK